MLYIPLNLANEEFISSTNELDERDTRKKLLYRALRVRVYPSKRQQRFIDNTLNCCRYVWNHMLSRNNKMYERRNEHLGYIAMQNLLPGMKKYLPWLKDADSQALKYACRQLDNAFNRFFQHISGFPTFKRKRNSKQSYTTTKASSIKYHRGKVSLPLVGNLFSKDKRELPYDAIITKATVTKDHSKYYVSIQYKVSRFIQPIIPKADTTIGIDYKSDGLYVDSDGICANMPHFYQDAEDILGWEQHKLARKVGYRKGEKASNNFKRQQERVFKKTLHIANQRKDFLHKQSTLIAKTYDCVCAETLNMKAMSNKGFGNGKATMNNGYGMFLNMLQYKMQERGKPFVQVDKWFPSSQLCSCCGYRNKRVKNLDVRTWRCPVCWTVHNRDKNSGINIKYEGLLMLGIP